MRDSELPSANWYTGVLDADVAIQVGVSRSLEIGEATGSSRAHRELTHASTHNVRALVRSMPTPVVMLDAARRIIMWNDRFERMIGRPAEGDEPSTSLLHVDYEQALESLLPLLDDVDALLRGIAPTSRVVELDNDEGERRFYSVDCRKWTDASDVVNGTIAVFHDITEIRESEQQLREANDELAQFNYRVSHDIVAPILTARGFLELAVGEIGAKDPAELADLLGELGGQLHRLDELVSDLSSLAQVSAEPQTREAVDLRRLIDVLGRSSERESRHAISIYTDLGIVQLRSNAARIRQILTNLIDNASKYHDPQEATSHVTVRSRRQGKTAIIDVIDNGVGIDPEFGKRAFEMFTRGVSAAAGTGLGLYITRKHVDRLGGTLSIEEHSKPTVIRITLPDSCEPAA